MIQHMSIFTDAIPEEQMPSVSSSLSIVQNFISTATEVLINPVLPLFFSDMDASSTTNRLSMQPSQTINRRSRRPFPTHRKGTVDLTNLGLFCLICCVYFLFCFSLSLSV